MARAVKVTSLGDKRLQVLQIAPKKEMVDRFCTKYGLASTANKSNLLASLMNTCYQARKELGTCIAELEIYLTALAITRIAVAE